jgi:tRNA 2-thiocytidine biosynthesis protein TtcA
MEKSERIASFMLKSLRKANRMYSLIVNGDRIAVAVSGGKDSQTLLRLLYLWQSSAPFRYELCAVHVVVDGVIPDHDDNREAVETLFRELGTPYLIRHIELTLEERELLDCYRCSWIRRKEIFGAAHELGCSKVAFGHHADDIAATALLNLFFHGRLESMAPRTELFDGAMTVIRPLALVEEKDIVYYARSAGFWQPARCCPIGETSQRARMGDLLRAVKKHVPRAQVNLYHAVEQACGWAEKGGYRP